MININKLVKACLLEEENEVLKLCNILYEKKYHTKHKMKQREILIL